MHDARVTNLVDGPAIGIIPARGGSVGIHRKNLRLLGGKPLLAYTIEAAQLSSELDDLYVSTEDVEIAAVAKSCGATGFAQDDAGFLNVLMKVGKPFLRSAEKAARTGVFLATEADASEVAGRYLVDSRVRAPSRLARDETGAARLWEETERLTSYRYPSVN